jgi:hypothetical protein
LDDVLSGRREPVHPGLAAVSVVQQAIDESLAKHADDPACPRCRSRHVKEYRIRTASGVLQHMHDAVWKHCLCCDLIFDLADEPE